MPRKVAEAEERQSREFNRAFGGNFQNAEMVKAFINSDEYRQRFGS